MPRSVRNFWIDASIDGRESTISGGPRSKEDGMSVSIKQRDEGQVTEVVKVSCFASSDGKELITRVSIQGNPDIKIVTQR